MLRDHAGDECHPAASSLVGGGRGPAQPGEHRSISEVIVEQVRLLIRQGHAAGRRSAAVGARAVRAVRGQPGDRPEACACSRPTASWRWVGARGGAFVTAPSGRLVGEGIADLISLATHRRRGHRGPAGLRARHRRPGLTERPRTRTSPRSTRSATGAARRSRATLPPRAVRRVAQPVRAVGAQPRRRHARRVAARPAAHVAGEGTGSRPLLRAARRRAPPLVDAIAARDADRAKQLMSEHLHRTAERIAALEVRGKPATPARSA